MSGMGLTSTELWSHRLAGPQGKPPPPAADPWGQALTRPDECGLERSLPLGFSKLFPGEPAVLLV